MSSFAFNCPVKYIAEGKNNILAVEVIFLSELDVLINNIFYKMYVAYSSFWEIKHARILR